MFPSNHIAVSTLIYLCQYKILVFSYSWSTEKNQDSLLRLYRSIVFQTCDPQWNRSKTLCSNVHVYIYMYIYLISKPTDTFNILQVLGM